MEMKQETPTAALALLVDDLKIDTFSWIQV
jgi:hypothetical protein